MSARRTMLLGLATGILLHWGAVVGVLGLEEVTSLPDPGPCVPPRNTSAPVGLRGYRRYFANHSLIGRPVPCTRDDKICFRHNLVFDPRVDRCEPIGGGGDGDCDLRLNRTLFETGSRVIGVCKTYRKLCAGYRMAYDGRCYRREVVRDVICGCGAKPIRHILDGVECHSLPAAPIRIQQPNDEGRCFIPDLRFPDIERSQFPLSADIFPTNRTDFRYIFECNTAQAACFANDKIRVKGFEGCHTLLEQGPCPVGHVVALNSSGETAAEATCVDVRGGCPQGYKRMLFDGQCHEDREITIEASGRVISNIFGENIITFRDRWYFVSLSVSNGSCALLSLATAEGMWNRRAMPPCGTSNQGRCDLYEVEAEPPLPEL